MSKLRVGDKTYDFALDNLTNKEGMALESVTGLTFGQWNKALGDMSTSALTALVWICRRREEPQLRFDDVEFNMNDFDIITDEPTEPQPGVPAQSAEFVPGEMNASFSPEAHGGASEASTTAESSI